MASLPPDMASIPPCMTISSVLVVSALATSAMRARMGGILPTAMSYSAQAPTGTFLRSTAIGSGGGCPGAWARARAGASSASAARQIAETKRIMGPPGAGGAGSIRIRPAKGEGGAGTLRGSGIRCSDPEADLQRPGVDVNAGKRLHLQEAVHRAQVAERDAEVAVVGDEEAGARIDAELPVRGRDGDVELRATKVAAAGEGFCERCDRRARRLHAQRC